MFKFKIMYKKLLNLQLKTVSFFLQLNTYVSKNRQDLTIEWFCMLLDPDPYSELRLQIREAIS